MNTSNARPMLYRAGCTTTNYPAHPVGCPGFCPVTKGIGTSMLLPNVGILELQNSLAHSKPGAAPYWPPSIPRNTDSAFSAWVIQCNSSTSTITRGDFCCKTNNQINCCDYQDQDLKIGSNLKVSAIAVKATVTKPLTKIASQTPPTSSVPYYITTVYSDQISSLNQEPTGEPSEKPPANATARKVEIAVGTICGILVFVLVGMILYFLRRRRRLRGLGEDERVAPLRPSDFGGLEVVHVDKVDRRSDRGLPELHSPIVPAEMEEKVHTAELGNDKFLAELEAAHPVHRQDFQPENMSPISANTTLYSPTSPPYAQPVHNCSHQAGASVSTLSTIASRNSFQKHDTLKFSGGKISMED